jgi:tripartite-type tricarboxylate transporter receptor subunit TctC
MQLRNHLVAWCAGLALAGVFSTSFGAAGDDYPARRIVCIVPTEAGGDGDLLARALLEQVSKRIGQPIVVVNKAGAAGAPGYRELHDAKPDGYTIGLAFPTLYMNRMQGRMPWDHRDFTLIAQHGTFTPIVISTAKTTRPLKTIKETIAYAGAHPGELKFALSVVGGSWWVAGMIFQTNTKTVFKNIPQEGSGAVVITQLAGGHTDVGVAGLASALSQIEAGNLNFIATFGEQRLPGKYSHVPTLIESGYNVTWDSPNFFVGPPGMPKQIVEKLAKAIQEETAKPEFQKAALAINATPGYRSSTQLLQYLDNQKKVSEEILRKNGLLKDAK